MTILFIQIDHKDNNNDGNGDCRESTICPPITSSSSSSNNPRKRKVTLSEDAAEDAVGAAKNADAAEDAAEDAVGAAENAVAAKCKFCQVRPGG